MTSPQSEQTVKEKMECIEEILEEVLLDAVISALLKVSDQIQLLTKNHRRWDCYRSNCQQREDMQF
jgi:hypothetical protein